MSRCAKLFDCSLGHIAFFTIHYKQMQYFKVLNFSARVSKIANRCNFNRAVSNYLGLYQILWRELTVNPSAPHLHPVFRKLTHGLKTWP